MRKDCSYLTVSQEKQEIRTVAVDFDGTVTWEHILPNWVFFLLLRQGMCFRQKIFFFCGSMVRGFLSLLFSRFPHLAEKGVKLSYMNFKGMETDTVEELICGPAPRFLRLISRFQHGENPDEMIIHLNRKLMPVLRHVTGMCRTMPEIIIYSQGSFPLAIRTFLQRSDVKNALNSVGICSEAVLLEVNEPEIKKDKIFTGRLKGKIHTKYNRICNLNESCLFIGDDADERVIRRAGLEKVRFVNWKRISISVKNPLNLSNS